MIQGKLEEMTKIQSGFGNYGNGLGQMLSETAGTGQQMVGEQKGQANETTDSKAFIPITAKNRIWDVEAISQISGRKSFKSSTLRKTMDTLQDFHDTMKGNISLASMEDSLSRAESAYEKLLEQVSHYVERGTKWYAGIHVHREEEKAVLPVMSTLLIKLYSLGNIFDHIENLSYDYLMKNQRENATLREVIESREALSVEGNMPSVNQQSGQIDRTAYQMKKRSPGQENITLNKRQELLQRELPTIGNGSEEEVNRYIRELEAIATMVDDLELQSSDALEREDVKIDFIDISKMIHILSQNPFLLTGKETGERGGNYRDEDLRLAAEYARKTQGMTVADALLHIDQLRQARAETAAADSIKAGGERSQVLIDIKEKRVLRTSKDTGGLKKQRAKNNFNYDEAVSRLGEITGLGSQAGARTTYYKDTEGNLQYGTNMEKASGTQARDVKLSFGNEEVDKNMRGGRYNIFGYGSPEELKKNGSLIISSFKLQILDYISYHQDRHYENFFIDLEADDPTQAFVGIDNDNVFGKGTSELKQKRIISYKEHAEKEYEGLDRINYLGGGDEIKLKLDYKGVTSTLKGFACIPKETLQQIMALDEGKLEEGMRPYLDRAARMAMMIRVRNLKEYAKTKAKKVDIYSPEGMREFKKETMKVMVNTIMDNRLDSDILGNAGETSLSRLAPGILTRAIMMQFFNLDGLAKDKNNPGEYIYKPSYEYIREGQSPEEYFATSNRKARNQDYWRVFDAMIQESGQTREQLWDYYMEQNYGTRRNEMEQKEEYKKLRELFVTGKMRTVSSWSQKDML